jgi:hypothetical protein
MESWRYQLTMGPPLFASADQQAIAQPRLKESVFVRLVDVHVAPKNEFDISGVRNEHEKFVTDPSTDNVSKLIFDLHAFTEYFWKSQS